MPNARPPAGPDPAPPDAAPIAAAATDATATDAAPADARSRRTSAAAPRAAAPDADASVAAGPDAVAPRPEAPARGRPSGFAAGFRAIVPLYMGIVPFGMAYAVSARGAGLGVLDTQLMSVAVFAGSAQFTAAGMFAVGASPAALVLTTFVINLRHLLYGLTLGQGIRLTVPQRVVAAQFLTDEAFGVILASGTRSPAFLFGAELSLFAAWNAATLAGALLGGLVPDPDALGIDMVFPLAFLALLVPLLRRPVDAVVAIVAGLGGLAAVQVVPAGLAVLLVGVAGALLGAWLTRGEGTDGADAPHARGAGDS